MADLRIEAFKEGLRERIASVVEAKTAGNWRQFAIIAEIPPTTLQSIKKGGAVPTIETLHRISGAGGVSIAWLLTGNPASGVVTPPDGSIPRAINAEILADVITGVELELADKNLTIDAKKKGEIIALLYDMIIEEEGKKLDRKRVAQVIKVAM